MTIENEQIRVLKTGDTYTLVGLCEPDAARVMRYVKWYRQIDVASLAGATVGEVTNIEKGRFVTPYKKIRILKVLGLIASDADDGNPENIK